MGACNAATGVSIDELRFEHAQGHIPFKLARRRASTVRSKRLKRAAHQLGYVVHIHAACVVYG